MTAPVGRARGRARAGRMTTSTSTSRPRALPASLTALIPPPSRALPRPVPFLPVDNDDDADDDDDDDDDDDGIEIPSSSSSRRVVVALNACFRELLSCDARTFWSHCVHDRALRKALDTYLQFRTRPRERRSRRRRRDANANDDDDDDDDDDALARRVFFVHRRLATPLERGSPFASMTRQGDALRDAGLLNVPKLLDLCALYGEGNEALVGELLEDAFQARPRSITLVPIRPRSRCELHSLRTFFSPGASLRRPTPRFQSLPSTPFNSTPDAFRLRPDSRWRRRFWTRTFPSPARRSRRCVLYTGSHTTAFAW